MSNGNKGARTGNDTRPAAGMLRSVIERLNARKSRILLIAQSSLPEPQFKAFRTLVLDEFGRNGLESELEALFDAPNTLGVDRNGQEHTMQERRCHDA